MNLVIVSDTVWTIIRFCQKKIVFISSNMNFNSRNVNKTKSGIDKQTEIYEGLNEKNFAKN